MVLKQHHIDNLRYEYNQSSWLIKFLFYPSALSKTLNVLSDNNELSNKDIIDICYVVMQSSWLARWIFPNLASFFEIPKIQNLAKLCVSSNYGKSTAEQKAYEFITDNQYDLAKLNMIAALNLPEHRYDSIKLVQVTLIFNSSNPPAMLKILTEIENFNATVEDEYKVNCSEKNINLISNLEPTDRAKLLNPAYKKHFGYHSKIISALDKFHDASVPISAYLDKLIGHQDPDEAGDAILKLTAHPEMLASHLGKVLENPCPYDLALVLIELKKFELLTSENINALCDQQNLSSDKRLDVAGYAIEATCNGRITCLHKQEIFNLLITNYAVLCAPSVRTRWSAEFTLSTAIFEKIIAYAADVNIGLSERIQTFIECTTRPRRIKGEMTHTLWAAMHPRRSEQEEVAIAERNAFAKIVTSLIDTHVNSPTSVSALIPQYL